jgi:hypothetical protein
MLGVPAGRADVLSFRSKNDLIRATGLYPVTVHSDFFFAPNRGLLVDGDLRPDRVWTGRS